MEVSLLVDTLKDGLEIYDKGKTEIRRCIPAIENKCLKIIKELSSSSNEEAEHLFDQLFSIQGILSQAVFVHDVEIGDKLMKLVKEFERLHDPYSRSYWLKRFKNGETWPNST